MTDLQDLLTVGMFLAGLVFIGGYVLLWALSPAIRRSMEEPKYRMLELDREMWGPPGTREE